MKRSLLLTAVGVLMILAERTALGQAATPAGQEQVAKAKAAVADLEKQTNQAESEFKRLRDLQAGGGATADQVQAARARLTELVAKVKAAKNDLETLQAGGATAPTASTPTSQPDQLAKAEALVKELDQKVNAAEVEFKRLRDAKASGAATAEQLTAAEGKLRDLLAQSKAARAAIEKLRSAAPASPTPAGNTTLTRQQQLARAEAKVAEFKQAESNAERQFKEVRDQKAAGKATQAQLDEALAKLKDLGVKLKSAQQELEQVRAAK